MGGCHGRYKVSNQEKIKWNLKANWMLYLMLAPAVIATILFMYVPIYGVVIAFQDYNPAFGFTGSPWVGFKWFRFVFQMPDFKDIMRNTVVIAVGKMFFNQLVPLVFALMLNEVRNKYVKKSVQTLVYMPHFFMGYCRRYFHRLVVKLRYCQSVSGIVRNRA